MNLPLLLAQNGLSWQALGVILAAVLGVGLVLFGTLMRHGGKLSAIQSAVGGLQKGLDENRADHKQFWDRLDNHEHRITVLEEHTD